ncbi:hypothetical protein ERJ64_01610 [Lactobacillus helveticus]|uniref:hypothetical protein n=1 Tax=Lactobacillus helveticus TaxID=1587 RepID=UPI0013FE4A68|nr:hypothetical protein [Lactobacillus helveticus]NHL82671.1 hypothetical protein [Lactobacillus helveticus]
MIKYNKGVRDFFKNDYPKLYLLSGSQITTKINSKDKSRVGYYWNIFAVTWLTINRLEDTPQRPYRTIIVEHCINHVNIKNIVNTYKHSGDWGRNRKNEALKKFAEIFKQEQIKNKVYPLLEFE